MATDWAELEAFVLDKMGATRLAGVSLAVVQGDEIIYQRGFGQRDLQRGLPATPRTLYGIGSVTKSFTCLAIMQLQERGLLSVDDPVERFLPLTVRPGGEVVRIRHLMSHTSGLPALAYLENLLRYRHGAVDRYVPVGNLDDMLTFMNGAQDWAYTRPGERWFYLNEGYVLLGGIIAKLSGLSYPEYIHREILTPLGMERTTFDGPFFHADSDAAVPYAVSAEGRHMARDYVWGLAQADGGMVSNTADMARYLAMYLGGGKGIISPESLTTMMTPVVTEPTLDAATAQPVQGYGFGLGSTDFFGRRLVRHNGLMYVCTAAMMLLPEQNLGAVALANGSGYPLANFTAFALAKLLGEDPWQLPALATERSLLDLAGAYETYQSTYEARVRRQGDFLMLEFKHKHSELVVPLVPHDLSNPANPRFYTLSLGRKMAVDFHVSGDRVDLIYERYRMRRTGK